MLSYYQKYKILIIGPTPPPYHGVSMTTENILNSNLHKRFRIIHLDTADRRSLSNIGKIDFVNVYLAFIHFFKFLWLCIKENPEVVYVPISQSALGYLRDSLFLISAKPFHRKVVVHLHGGYFREFYDQSNKLMKLLIQWTLKDVQRVIVLGQSLKYIFRGLVPDKKIAVVPNGIEGKTFNELRLKYQNSRLGKDPLKILFLGSLMRTKGFIDVMHAIPQILSKRNDVKFVFAGEIRYSKERQEVDSFMAKNNLKPFIEFTAVVSGKEKIRLFLSSDIFIFPPVQVEGQPLVILEAMAAGLPIITTDTGAITEAVLNGVNGFIIEKRNSRQIVEKILLLIENESLRKKMGEKSREQFLKHYTQNKFIENLAKLFQGVFSEGKRRFYNKQGKSGGLFKIIKPVS